MREGSCDGPSTMELREIVSGDGALRRPFMLPDREWPGTFSGKMSAIPGSGGNGLFMSAASEVVLLIPRSLAA